ncbi:FAD-binding oxidoreductase [Nakamurella sp. DB0629]|uniref:FAD-binding oxidoreductase n=1 Tax=Nakamurella aerolata TaxID=1656892 RepID=A0A849AAH4_9ACTN|nr:FAD-binding oxidoreductase [Nakamurella aerolata]
MGFLRSGGLELATSESAAGELHRRVEAARAAGLPAELLPTGRIPQSVASFVDTHQIVAVARYAADGSADMSPLMTALRDRITAGGARLISSQEVTAVEQHGASVAVRTASGDRFAADALVLAGGVWGPRLARLTGVELPLFPVAHPYAYGAPTRFGLPGPFVRWPEHHVYSRIHGDRLGIGSYDHRPVSVEQDELRDGARLAWADDFAPVIEAAQRLLRPEARFTPVYRINGVFAMSPDNLPFLGRHPDLPNVWIAQALWITHAAGATQRLATALLNDTALPDALSIDRFDGIDHATLRTRALRRYREIYANDAT